MEELTFMTYDGEHDLVDLVEEVKQIDNEIREIRKIQQIEFAKVMKRRAAIKDILYLYCIDGEGNHKWEPLGPYDSYCVNCGANR